MITLQQAAQQALEALREFGYHGSSPRWERTANALKAAIAQPKQEPSCPECKAGVLYECVACSSNNYPPKPEQEPTPWREMIVASLVREGVNKHRARELADHFAAQPAQEPVAWAVQACSKMWRGEFAEIDAKAEAKRCGGTCVAYPLYTAPAQREWQGLTDDDWEKVANRKNTVLDTFEQGAAWAAYKLERRNT